ncbi:MAG: hypothetical protein K0S18_1178 [Anaerocolumna sp.]|jgi:hypothetical protein|nr:hypothetical protein [Anaerocolumna sp.]
MEANMTHKEYKQIISDAIIEYCNNGGSLLNIALNQARKEYIYEFDYLLPEDDKQSLIDKAHQAMQKNKDLPKGIRLIKVKFY